MNTHNTHYRITDCSNCDGLLKAMHKLAKTYIDVACIDVIGAFNSTDLLQCNTRRFDCNSRQDRSRYLFPQIHLLQHICRDSRQEAQLPQRNSASAAHMEGGGLGPPAHSPSATSYAYGRIRKPQRTYVKHAVRKAHFKMNPAFKVIQGHPYWCRQEFRMVCCRNVQLMPTLFLKLSLIHI